MGRRSDVRTKVEFGDFQTPPDLASEVCRLLSSRGFAPKSIVEPTCGRGSLLFAALGEFPQFSCALGADVNDAYVRSVRSALTRGAYKSRVKVNRENFFETEWSERIAQLPEPILFVGNPPWVTNSDLGYLNSHNIPEKSNFHGRAGIDALTGKGNFDISEWMLIKLLSWLDGRDAVMAMLCKTAVARKVLSFGWNAGFRIESAATYRIDTTKHFGAAVDACLLVCELGRTRPTQACRTFESLGAKRPSAVLGYRDGGLIADVALYDRQKHLVGESPYRWRSGVKHDCAAVMELRRFGDTFENGAGESVELEEEFLYPMLKSSEVAREGPVRPSRFMVVTQKLVGEDTSHIQHTAPLTWKYLTRHRASFERRGSSIYRGKPPFSIFGVGDYTYAPWKVAISGLYKKLEFRVVGPYEGKPVVLDDTCYFLGCASEAEAQMLWSLLSSLPAQQFYSAFVFWDAKRPITTDLLRRLDLWRLAQELDRAGEFHRICVVKAESPTKVAARGQLALGLDGSYPPTRVEPTRSAVSMRTAQRKQRDV
ncbi:MAG: SAM-dependent DNA methyltransferase [Kofleriaceae bacterium]